MERFSEYWEKAWSQRTIIDTLRENGYTTNLYIDKVSTYGNVEEIQGRTDNLMYDGRLIVHLKGLLNMTGRLSLGRLSPYLFKNFFLSSIDASFGNEMFIYSTDKKSDVARPSVNVTSDLDFYRYIKSNDLLVGTDMRVFNFIHMNCSHTDRDITVDSLGYHIDEKDRSIVRGGNYIETTRACFDILSMYFNKMKNINVYDNSTIILVADHGATTKATACLFIKPRESRGELKIDITSELSNKYFGASVIETAGIPHKAYGLSYFDIINGAVPPVRIIYGQTNWWTARNDAEMVILNGTYEVVGDANNFENWKYTVISE